MQPVARMNHASILLTRPVPPASRRPPARPVAALKAVVLRAVLLFALAWLPQAGSAQEPAVPELDALKQEYDALVGIANAPHLAALVDLDKKYLARLVKEQEAAQQGGKLEEAVAIETEKKTVTSGSGVPLQDAANTPPVLKKMHATYRSEVARLEALRDKKIKPLRDDFAKKLEVLTTSLTKKGKLEEALTVKRFRESLPALAAGSAAAPLDPAPGRVMAVDLPGGGVMKFCYCPPGSFKMGSPPAEKNRITNEDQVKVHFSKGFWMAQTECTQAQWVAVMGNNPSALKGDELPVESVNWNDAQAFIAKLIEAKTLPAGWKVALPTEAQWEYACRAGTKTTYSFGETLTPKQANFGKALGKPSAVASYPANAWGLYDMHGNVSEWCEDWLGDKLTGGTDPKGVAAGSSRVGRGGNWDYLASSCRAAIRSSYSPGNVYSYVGFRVVLSPTL